MIDIKKIVFCFALCSASVQMSGASEMENGRTSDMHISSSGNIEEGVLANHLEEFKLVFLNDEERLDLIDRDPMQISDRLRGGEIDNLEQNGKLISDENRPIFFDKEDYLLYQWGPKTTVRVLSIE